ncbi:hypothetical protein J1N35_011097 [Gossypium stocksii]|uniref:Uncharacterized protein n=1 Tax=Gossypium stocksii TaxID=47602 RepID=A0A9D3W1U2_9ROSI|nr:hypothetical protein J1N35_011097 [Gossypium stocksii]
MELLDDENVEAMVALYCPTRRVNTKLIQLFAKLADVEPVEDVTLSNQQYGVEDPCAEVLRAFFGRQLSVCGCGIVIRNDPRAYMLSIDLYAAYAYEFLKYPQTLPVHLLLANLESKELFVGQQFATKDDCIISINWYSIKLLVDHKVTDSKTKIYVRDYWKMARGCKW